MTVDLHGIIPPMVTPFDGNEDVDTAALCKEVRFQIGAGVHGICVTGSTGEGASLTAEETALVARTVVDEVSGQVPVIAGIIRDSTRDVIRYAKALADTGVTALQITPVHYLFTPGPDATVEYYRRITDEVGLPVVIYNVVPWARIEPQTLYRIMQEIPLVIGVKQSGGDMHALADLLKLNPSGGRVLTAVDDLLYPSFVLGAQGAIAATLTVVPTLCVRLWDAVARADHAEARRVHELLLPVWRSIDGPNMPARIKSALAMQGRDGGRARSPMSPTTDAERATLRAALTDAGVLN
jgi:4-hydroxy-tetrahydrodipicolinate synthase